MAGIIIEYLFVMLSVFFWCGSCEVSLINYLVDETAPFGDVVNFTCRTIGSNTLVWNSPEYIGQNGKQLSLSPLNLGTTSSLNTYAVATVTNTYIENGQRVLESNLTIIVQGNIPSASVICSSLGTGESSMTSFRLAKNPMIECENLVVCPGNVRIFTCETRGSTSLSWESAEYIGDIAISFTPRSPLGYKVKSRINPEVSASLMMNYEINGVRVLMSQLIVTVSEDILDDMHHVITCLNIGLDVNDNRTLHMPEDGICSYPGPTESETTQSGSITGRNDTQNNSENLDKNSAFLYIVIGCSAAVGAIVAITVALLGAIVIRLICIKTKAVAHSVQPDIFYQDKHQELEDVPTRYI